MTDHATQLSIRPTRTAGLGPEGIPWQAAHRLRRVAVLSVHTSPLEQPGTGGAGARLLQR